MYQLSVILPGSKKEPKYPIENGRGARWTNKNYGQKFLRCPKDENRKAGFVYEGTMKDCEIKFGKYISLRIYALLQP